MDKEFAEMAERVKEARRLKQIKDDSKKKYEEAEKAFWDYVNTMHMGDNITLDD